MRNAEAEFLGTGWTFPPTFSRGRAVVLMATGEEDVRQSLRVLFYTAPGERVMLPTYGCDLWRMVFGTLTTTLKTQIAEAVRMAVLNWEPRVDVDAVTVASVPREEGMITVELAYTIRQTNSRDNLVFPFYVREGTLVPAAAHAAGA